MQFPIIIEKDKDGYYATCPSLPGCSTQGVNYEETLNNIKDAIGLYVKDCLDDNEFIIANENISFQMVEIPIDKNLAKND